MDVLVDVLTVTIDRQKRMIDSLKADLAAVTADLAQTRADRRDFRDHQLAKLREDLAAATAEADRRKGENDRLIATVVTLEDERNAATARAEKAEAAPRPATAGDMADLVRRLKNAAIGHAEMFGRDATAALFLEAAWVLADIRPLTAAAGDVEAAARRIVDGVKPGGEVDGYSPTTDQWWVIDRYRELRRTTHQSFLECAIQARVEFVARVLSELHERRPAAIMAIVEETSNGHVKGHQFERAEDAARFCVGHEDRRRLRLFAFDGPIEWHPASRPGEAKEDSDG